MIATARYLAAEVLASQRYLAPVLLYLALVATLTDHGSAPILPSFALDGGVLVLCGAWLAVVVHNHLDDARRAVLTVTAGSGLRVLLGGIGAALAGCAVLAAAGTLYAVVVNGTGVTAAQLGAAVLADLTCACTGVAVGTLCSRPVLARTGYALTAALAVLLALVLVPGAPPVNRVLRSMTDTARAVDLLGPLAGYLVLGVVLLAAAAAVADRVATRRD